MQRKIKNDDCHSLIRLGIFLLRTRAIGKRNIYAWLRFIRSELLSFESVTFDLRLKISKNVCIAGWDAQRQQPSTTVGTFAVYSQLKRLFAHTNTRWRRCMMPGATVEIPTPTTLVLVDHSGARVCVCVKHVTKMRPKQTRKDRMDEVKKKISKNLKSAHKN